MFRKFLKDYFTFSRSERNGLIVLVVIIAVLACARIVIPHIRESRSYDFSEFQEEINEFEKSLKESDKPVASTDATKTEPEHLFFDPNSATPEELENAGLEPRVARNILKYREKGGRFNQREDLKKIYGLDSTDYLRIEQYIIINTDKTDTVSSRERLKRQLQIPLNTADSSDLASIYGIGPVLSVRIIKYRKLLGGYVSKDQLLEVYGMTSENFSNIRDFVFIDSSAIIRINLNKAVEKDLSAHPYLNDYQARSLIAYREIKGRFLSTDEIIRNSLLPEDIYKKIRPYLATE
jgi:competence protein ComEA